MLGSLRILVLAVFAVTSLQAQTHFWTGNGGDSSWFTASNWDVNSVPDINSHVVISNGTSVIDNFGAVAASISLQDNAELRLVGSLELESMDIAATTTFHFEEGELIGVPSVITNQGTIRLQGFETRTFENIIIENHQFLEVAESNLTEVLNTSINNQPSGIIDISSNGGMLEQSSTSVLTNFGTVIKSQGSTSNGNFYLIFEINNRGIIEVKENQAFLLLSGTDTLTNFEEGVMQGNGIFDITAEFINFGTVFPGNPQQVGELEITNNFTVNGGTIGIDILSKSGDQYDSITIFGTPTLDGTFQLNLLDPNGIEIGDTFDVITWNLGGSSCNFPAFVSGFDETGTIEFIFEVLCENNRVQLVLHQVLLEVDNFEIQEFTIAPNPVESFTTFSFSSELFLNASPQLHIYNVLGQLVFTEVNLTENYVFHRNNLPSGLYFTRLETEHKVIATNQLVLK